MSDATAQMWSRTELTPADLQVAQLYDGFTFLTIAWLEALGICGDGGSLVREDDERPAADRVVDAAATPDGRPPAGFRDRNVLVGNAHAGAVVVQRGIELVGFGQRAEQRLCGRHGRGERRRGKQCGYNA